MTADGRGDPRLEAALRSWRDSLVLLSGRNRLLNYRPTRSSTLEFVRMTADEVIAMIGPRKGVPVMGTVPATPTASSQTDVQDLESAALDLIEEIDFARFSGHLFVNKTQRDVDRGLKTLAATAARENLDRGLSVLYLAMGALRWQEANGDQRVSPLVFLPVELRSDGPKQPHRVYSSDEDLVVNPALEIRLREHGVMLPDQAAVEGLMNDGGVVAMEDAVRALKLPPGWGVEPLCVLSAFMFAKEAMFRDLEANEDRVLGSPLIQALGGSEATAQVALVFAPADSDEIDDVAPPEDTPLILDADSTQRVAIAAARDGRSFVLDGPPGTGKSQTIANIIATLVEDGKRVLFVSEKAVALDVVRDRLAERSLRPLLFELHSHKATRAEVAKSLGQALSEKPSIEASGPTQGTARVKELRLALTAYATAMNARRMPSGWSLHHVMGQLAGLPTVDLLPPMLSANANLTPEVWEEILDLSDAVARSWEHVRKGEAHLWFGVTDVAGLQYDVHEADLALSALREAMETVAPDLVALAIEGPGDWERLDRLAAHWRDGDQAWRDAELTAPASEDARARLGQVIEAAEIVVDDDARLRLDLGESWRELIGSDVPMPTTTLVESLFPALAECMTASLIERSATVGDWLETSRRATELGLEIADGMGLRVPRYAGELRAVRDSAACIVETEPLQARHLTAAAVEDLTAALDELETAQTNEREARLAIEATFLPSIREVDVAPIDERWRSLPGWRKSLLGPGADDRRSVVPHLRVKPRAAFANIDLAVNWQNARNRLAAARRRVSGIFDIVPDDESSWAVARRTLQRCEFVLARVGEPDTPRLRTAQVNEFGWVALSRRVAELSSTVDRLDALAERLGGVFGDPSRESEPFALATDSAKREVDQLLRSVAPFSDTGALTLAHSHERMIEANAAGRRWRAATASLAELGEFFPELRQTITGNWVDTSRRRSDWIATLRNQTEGIDSIALTEGLATLVWAEALGRSGRRWYTARQALVSHFDHDVYAAELIDFDDARSLLDDFGADIDGAQQFSEAATIVGRLRTIGLGDALDAMIRESVSQDAVRDIVRAIALSSWTAEVEASDDRLRSRLPMDRDGLVAQFKELDRALVDQAAARVLAGAGRRRPSTPSAQTSLILAEAGKKKRHRPVRELIAGARDVIQALHPCFMMSPLAVSQYLPPDLEFDVVIFDEASQVPPGDAINCIYRARALIAAGDQRQLPPTSFFSAAQSSDDDIDGDEDLANDYESLLDLMKSSGSFTNIGLRWHYRSRHEHLIAYSNNSFYDDRLITFPGALAEVPDAGVKLLKVDGVYRRSQGQDNPKEAQFVAKRIIHHLDTRPGKSIGVVAMSAAQRDAILNALLVERSNRPDLDERFVESRLDGIFVKSLEEVQGDERDVIIMSVGYGPDDTGTVYRNFGPINKQGGERRLNVAITRAKELTEVVASMSAGDIGDVASVGGRHLRRYLDYAERGPAALAMELGSEGRGTDSPFEDAVVSAVRSWGYEVQPQVGVSGFRIDIGVKHPSKPGVFMLGIECDGAMYHSSKTARDRDRLRHEILVGLGWNLHHIWGTDWYRNRDREMARLKNVLESAERSDGVGRLGAKRPPSASPVLAVEAQDFDARSQTSWMEPYVAFSGKRLRALDWTDLHNARYLVDFLEGVVEVEGPVHIDLVKARLREHSSMERVNKHGLRTIIRAIQLANLRVDGDFALAPSSTTRAARVAGGRTLPQVHDSEFRLAVLGVIESQVASTRRELPASVSRAFGWLRTPAEAAERIDEVIRTEIGAGRLVESEGTVRIAR